MGWSAPMAWQCDIFRLQTPRSVGLAGSRRLPCQRVRSCSHESILRARRHAKTHRQMRKDAAVFHESMASFWKTNISEPISNRNLYPSHLNCCSFACPGSSCSSKNFCSDQRLLFLAGTVFLELAFCTNFDLRLWL